MSIVLLFTKQGSVFVLGVYFTDWQEEYKSSRTSISGVSSSALPCSRPISYDEAKLSKYRDCRGNFLPWITKWWLITHALSRMFTQLECLLFLSTTLASSPSLPLTEWHSSLVTTEKWAENKMPRIIDDPSVHMSVVDARSCSCLLDDCFAAM